MSNDRNLLLRRLNNDLVGPLASDEILSDRPSDVYLTGILWPWDSRMGGEEDDRLGAGDGEDGGEEEEVPLAGQPRPCTAGLSFALACDDGEPTVFATFRCGTYAPEENSVIASERRGPTAVRWRRRSHELTIGPIPCGDPFGSFPLDNPEPGVEIRGLPEDGVVPKGLELHVRTIPISQGRLVTMTAINRANVDREGGRQALEEAIWFQVELVVRPASGTRLIARPSRRAIVDDDDRSAALLYRGVREFAVGHTCSAQWDLACEPSEFASFVSTTWVPTAIVPAVNPGGHVAFADLNTDTCRPLSASWLACAGSTALREALSRIPDAYERWLAEKQDSAVLLQGDLRRTADTHLVACSHVLARMREGVEFIASRENAALAFRLANRAMQLQYEWDPEKAKTGTLTWRPFQIGFVLLTVKSVVQREHDDRGVMDLLWFPTGGGKTEAYLALTAFLMFYRRLESPQPNDGAGVAAIMRYTLRLLTTQQFSRAAAMILACEAIRRGRVPGISSDRDFGSEPFSIGLWVGGEATPNTFGEATDALSDPNLPSPRQILACPACRGPINWTPNISAQSIEARCPRDACVLHHPTAPLPIWTVDQDVYAHTPTLVIGTVDKFAQIVRKKEVNRLFAVQGDRPPDLIIQDELHLISGPLGTVVGMYEVIVDRLLSRGSVRPKVIGSTATIRRAGDQVSALFNRGTCQFPPPGLDAADSGFAVIDHRAPGRLYAGITTAGRSAKFTLQATAGTILQSSAVAFSDLECADPYWTLVTYFNSLRELGGALVLMQDDVADGIQLYAGRRSETERSLQNIEELTSRRSQAEVRDMLEQLAFPAGADGSLDVVLASNMLSVGVDVPRLGLMLMNGQPKGIAEYIQATSRVGRRHPGLVLVVLNHAKARDRSHFETFRTWHQTLYRDVEATSVTPFASRSRDRALHATLVALVRHLVPGMLDKPDLDGIPEAALAAIIDDIVGRADTIDPSETSVRGELDDRLDKWRMRSPSTYWNDRQSRGSLLQSAERAATQRALGRWPGDAWPTLNNMRNVEPSVMFRLAEALRERNTKDGGGNGQ